MPRFAETGASLVPTATDTNPYFLSQRSSLRTCPQLFARASPRCGWFVCSRRRDQRIFGYSFCRWLDPPGSESTVQAPDLAAVLTPSGRNFTRRTAHSRLQRPCRGASLVLVALVLTIIHDHKPPRGLAGLRAVSLVLLLQVARVAVVALLSAVTTVLLAPSGISSALRHLALAPAGFVTVVAFVHVAVFPLDKSFDALVAVTRSTASASHGVSDLAAAYLRSTARLAAGGAVIALPAALAYVQWRRTDPAGDSSCSAALLRRAGLILVAPFVFALAAQRRAGCRCLSGERDAPRLLAAVARSRSRDLGDRVRGERPVLVVLILVPVCQAIGTTCRSSTSPLLRSGAA